MTGFVRLWKSIRMQQPLLKRHRIRDRLLHHLLLGRPPQGKTRL